MWERQRLGRLCVSLALAGAVVLPAPAQQPREAEALEAELAEVREQIEAIQSRIDRDLAERDALADALAEAERAVGRARRAQAETDRRLADVGAEIDRLEREREALETRTARRASELAIQLATAYRQGVHSRLKMLLDQEDPRRLARRLAYHGYLTRARVEAIEALKASLEELALTRERLDRRAEELAALLETRKRETRRLEAARAERERALAALDERIENDRARLAQLRRNARELTALIEELGEVLADVPPEMEIPPFESLKGRLPMPVAGPVLEAYGDRRSGDLEWTGWLIDTEAGREVTSVAHGRVAYADWLRGYGLLLIIDHGEEYMSLYAHNEALMRDVGDWVAPGDVVALAGRSGGVERPALYFELRSGGRPVDPAAWIDR